jgi:hypothetical protein
MVFDVLDFYPWPYPCHRGLRDPVFVADQE